MASLSAIALRFEVPTHCHIPDSYVGRWFRRGQYRPATTPGPAMHGGNSRIPLSTLRWLARCVGCCAMGLWFLAFLPRLHAQPAVKPAEASTPSPPPPAQPSLPAPGSPTEPPAAGVAPPVVENIPPGAPLPPSALDASAASASDRTPAAAKPRVSLLPEIPGNTGPFRAGILLTDGTLIGGTVTSYVPERSVTILTAFGSRSVIAWRDIAHIQRFAGLPPSPTSEPAAIPSGGPSQNSGPRTTAVYLIFTGSLVLTIGGVIGTYFLIDYVSKHPPSIHLWDLPAI